MVGHCSYAMCALLLLAFAWVNIRTTLPIFGVLAILGVTRAFQMPAGQSFVPNIVPTAILRNALAINSSANQIAAIAGPSVGGIVYAIAEVRLGRTAVQAWFTAPQRCCC